MRVIRRIGHWLDDRLQLGMPIRDTMAHPIPRETASWFYVFGSAALTVFALQVVTGILLALIYNPSASEAWNSLQLLNHQVTLGWFIRALHGWGSNFMLAIVLIHMVQVFLFGAYKFPRELTWIIGVLLLLLTLGMAFTGQVLRFDQEAAAVNLSAAAKHVGLSPGQVIIMASLVQAEGGRLSDYPKIARVIYNRLNQSPPMPLQLDTTVLYALHSTAPDVTIAQTQVNSPYNTYLHTGLPPGPIDSPGDAAIQAALHPAAGNWTYFLTVDPKTGLTLFTNSFTQFQQFQAQLAQNTKTG